MKGTLVYHLIHVQTPRRHIPKLLIEDYFATKEEINRAGYSFGEFGIPWANHIVLHFDKISDIPPDAIPSIKGGEVTRISKDDFLRAVETL